MIEYIEGHVAYDNPKPHLHSRHGYFPGLALLSTGEIAPDFGAKQALVAYQRDDEARGAGGFRLVMPGDKHGGRNVRDVVTIDVE